MRKLLFLVFSLCIASAPVAFEQEIAGLVINYPSSIQYSELITMKNWQGMDLSVQRRLFNYQALKGPPSEGFDYIAIHSFVFHDHINIEGDSLGSIAESMAESYETSNPSMLEATSNITEISRTGSPRVYMVETEGVIQGVRHGISAMLLDLPDWNVRWIVALGYYESDAVISFENQKGLALSVLQGISFVQ